MKANPHWRRTLGLLAAVNFVNYVDREIFAIVLEPIKIELALSDQQAGLLVGAFALLYAGLAVPIGLLVDRFRRVTILSIAVALWSLMTAAGGLAKNFAQLFLARIGVGVGEAACLPVGISIIGDVFPVSHRSGAVSVFNAAALVGSVAGAILMGFLADAFGWRVALYMVGLPGLLLAAAVWYFLPEPSRGGQAAANIGKPDRAAFGKLLQNRTYLLWLVALPATSLGLSTIGLWGPAWLIRSFDLSLAEIGLYFGLTYLLGAALGTVIGGTFSVRLISRDRRWEFWIPAASLVLAIPVQLLALSADTAVMAFSLVSCAAIVSFFGYGPAVGCVQSVAGPQVRGTAAALGMATAALVGMFMGPWLVGALADTLAVSAGDQALRRAMMIATFSFLPAGVLFLIGGLWIRRDAVD